MALPIVTTAGATNGVLKITDQDGQTMQIPLVSLCGYSDTSNASAKRLDIASSCGSITLIFDTQTEVDTAVAFIDALF